MKNTLSLALLIIGTTFAIKGEDISHLIPQNIDYFEENGELKYDYQEEIAIRYAGVVMTTLGGYLFGRNKNDKGR